MERAEIAFPNSMKLRDSRGIGFDGFTLEGINGRDSVRSAIGELLLVAMDGKWWTLNEALMGKGHGFLECSAALN